VLKSARSTFTAPVAALESACDALSKGTPDALLSVRRIAGRIQDAAIGLGLRDAGYAAAAVLEAERTEEVVSLANYLIQQLRTLPEDGVGEAAVILMVEDDRLTAQVLADAIRGENREIVIAHSAAAAIERINDTPPSLVLLDLVLPDADGRDLLVRLRASPNTQTVPILVITARDDAATTSECFALGADGVMSKPVEPEVLSSAVAAKLQQARQQHLENRTDRLTGLPNRVAFFEALERALPVAHQQRRPMSVVMIDLDHFKTVNAQHGHATGDVVLQRAGQRVATALRISDFVARWGGEEFCVFLPNTTVEGAVTALEKALQEVRRLRFEGTSGRDFSITFSAGVAPLPEGTTPEQAIAEADRLLYLAKAGGRNRVVSPKDQAAPLRAPALLVEDEENVARVVKTLLDREGFAVEHFRDGESALQAAQSQSFALAILDVGLPGMSGFELLQHLRELRAMPTLPIMMLTGSVEEEDVVRGFDLGVNDYMTKPFHTTELAARLRRLMNRR
jgi:two-component system cell cycle response regulator